MNIKDYQQLALRTEAPCGAVLNRVSDVKILGYSELAYSNLRLLHAALGLTSDINELVHSSDRTNEIEEAGDSLWYAAIACEALHADIASSFTDGLNEDRKWSRLELSERLRTRAAEVADATKAKIFYGKSESDATPIDVVLLGDVQDIVRGLALYCTKFLNLSIEEVMEANIAKLRARFPDAYSQARALERDKAAERSAINAGPFGTGPFPVNVGEIPRTKAYKSGPDAPQASFPDPAGTHGDLAG